MASLNRATILGSIGQDPELKKLPTGKSVCTFSVATSEKRGDKEETTWHRVVSFDKLADLCSGYLAKGSQVLVEGRLQYRKYKGSDGVERQSTEIVASNVQFVGSKPQTTPATPEATREQDFF